MGKANHFPEESCAKARRGFVYKGYEKDISVWEVTADSGAAHCHIYTEAPVFTPDSQKYIFARLTAQDYNSPNLTDTGPLYMVCEVENNYRIRQITDEPGACGMAVAPDGSYMYYLVASGRPGQSSLLLKRVSLSDYGRETLCCLDKPLSGCLAAPFASYPIGTISADGRRLAEVVFLGDGKMENAPWGILLFDLETLSAEIIWEHETLFNAHPQYCRHMENGHDLMIQQNHGAFVRADGRFSTLVSGLGADIHAICDDGTNLRDFPWGRNGREFCQGHQCWRGETGLAVTSTVTYEENGGLFHRLIESPPVRPADAKRHTGYRLAGASGPPLRAELSRFMLRPEFMHFSFDKTGEFLAADCRPAGKMEEAREVGYISLGEYKAAGEDGQGAFLTAEPVLRPQSSWQKLAHPHPFFSPDRRRVFFNSDAGGRLQIWAAELGDMLWQGGRK